MLFQIVGLVAGLALLIVGVSVFVRVQSSIINTLPAEWREHPDLRDRYSAALTATTADEIRSLPRSILLVWFLLGGVLVLLNTAAWSEPAWVVVTALWVTHTRMGRSAREGKALAQTLQLPTPTHKRRVERMARYVAQFTVWGGYLAIGVFAGGALAQAVR